MSCFICGSDERDTISERDRHGKPLVTTVCRGCGLVANDPIPSEEELRAFYAQDYRRSYKKTRQPKKKHHLRYGARVYDAVAAQADLYRGVNSVLDVGSGSGEFLALMKAAGRRVQGVEPTRDYAAYVAETFDVPVFAGSVDDFETEARFDLIRLSHVLEHMRDPVARLARLKGFLAEGGLLLISVPDFPTYCRRKSPGSIFHYGHIWNFDQETLEAAAALAGLKAVRTAAPSTVYFAPCAPFVRPVDPENAARNKRLYAEHLEGALIPPERPNRLGQRLGRIAREAWAGLATPPAPAQLAAKGRALADVIG